MAGLQVAGWADLSSCARYRDAAAVVAAAAAGDNSSNDGGGS